jgi:predicted alpha/beta superfamily hydrolase
MKLFLIFFWMLAVALITAQTKQVVDVKVNSPLINEINTEPVSIGYSFKLHSQLLDEDRTIMVALPNGYNTSTTSYPVFYLTDAQWNFNLSVNAISVLVSNGLIPPMIVVGVHTIEKREWDLLPTKSESIYIGGGADKFYSFIKDELIPFVDKNYRTNSYRTLTGSSFGGVFIMHAFLSNPKLFNAYLTLSPSMWWDNNVMLKRTEDFLKNNPDLKSYLYVTVADEGLEMGVNSLADLLKKYPIDNLRWKFDEYPEELHGTVCYKGTYDGLRFVFANWNNKPVAFETKGGLLNKGDSIITAIKSNSKIIRYTLDGSQPDENSQLYQEPIIVTKPLTIKAIPYFGYDMPGTIDSLKINYIQKLSATTNLPPLKNGLKYFYYEGNWDKLPDFKTLTPTKTGVAENFKSIRPGKNEFFGVNFSGFLDITKDDIYNFFLLSDDGSKLFIDNNEIINNDGLHGNLEVRNQVYLQKGKHSFSVLFFQKAGGMELILSYSSKEITKQVIPDSVYYYDENRY